MEIDSSASHSVIIDRDPEKCKKNLAHIQWVNRQNELSIWLCGAQFISCLSS